MNSLCLLFFLLTTGLEFSSCFEDNTKNIVLIKIYDLKKHPKKLVNVKTKLNEAIHLRDQNLNQSSNEVLDQDGEVDIFQDNSSNISQTQIETFEKSHFINESSEASLNIRMRKSIHENKHTENFETSSVNPKPNANLIQSISTDVTESNTLVTESITKEVDGSPLTGTMNTTTQVGKVDSTTLIPPMDTTTLIPPVHTTTQIPPVYNAEEPEATPTVFDFLPQLSGNTREMYYEECSGLIIKQDFVLTAASCVRNMAGFTDSFLNESPDSFPNKPTTIYQLRVQIILFDGTIGYARRSYLWNEVFLLQVLFEEGTRPQYHLFFPHKSVPLGASIPSECRVEGHVYNETNGRNRDAQYTTTLLGRNSVYKHCPASTSSVYAALLKDYDNVLCAYTLDGADSKSMKSLCNYLPGASLFCPELQGLLYTTYLRSAETTSNNFAGGRSIGNWEDEDDTMSVVNEILDEFNLTNKVPLNETLLGNQTLTNQSNSLEFDKNRANSYIFEKNQWRQLPTERKRLNKTFYRNQIKFMPAMNRSLVKSNDNWKEQKTSLVTQPNSCGSTKEVALFVNTHFNVVWIKRTVRTYTAFKGNAVRCGYNVNNFVIVTLTVLVLFN